MAAAVHCAALGATQGAIAGAVSGAISGAVTGAVKQRITTGSWAGAGQAAIDGAASGFMSGSISGAVTGALASPYCFVAGTAVLTAAGSVLIEDIKPGDFVWAWDEETGDVSLKPVVETYINETTELVHVFVDGEEIIATPSHPFYSPVKGWTDAVHLRAGDILVLVNGEYVVVEKVQHELLESPVNVYNFQVADYHTYYVANTGVLVHNVCRAAKDAQLPTEGKIRYVPPKNAGSSLPRTASGGYVDKFGNVWVKGPSRTLGEPFEWDVQLLRTGKNMLGWLSRDGSHINVSLKGVITHR